VGRKLKYDILFVDRAIRTIERLIVFDTIGCMVKRKV